MRKCPPKQACSDGHSVPAADEKRALSPVERRPRNPVGFLIERGSLIINRAAEPYENYTETKPQSDIQNRTGAQIDEFIFIDH